MGENGRGAICQNKKEIPAEKPALLDGARKSSFPAGGKIQNYCRRAVDFVRRFV